MGNIQSNNSMTRKFSFKQNVGKKERRKKKQIKKKENNTNFPVDHSVL